ncbi:DRTGG domain protein [Halodesulfurarchaeum formicicum]|uniref:DRTGG domain protein n=1 Tax=Halodesulfurarchaeum formicicum TaxID=1873524 RepID=A0A1D8S456_9EURY|nr:phosphotransacetylase family protein [Halodesulfurarchaeum formicicum]AOW80139.1 DRTGG domain protein [Halodesulfurarchaeum formicicum]
MKTLLLASTEDSTGKTAVALALGQLAQAEDRSVGYMKPKGTRLQSNVGKTLDTDPMLAREVLGIDAEMHEMEPIVYSTTFIEGAIRGQENLADLHERIDSAFETLAAEKDLMVVEGADVYTTGGIVDLADDEVAARLDAEVLLLERFESAGDIDHLLAAADRMGDRVAGVVFNAVPDSMYDLVESDVVPFLEGRDIPVLGVIPQNRELAGVTLTDLTDELGGSVLTGADEDVFIERVLVGAMGGEAALSHFRRTKDAAVVTGGDRADIQRAALEAPGVNALILTGGFEPPGAVLGTASERNVPVLSVQSDTLATVERAERLIRGGRVRDARTVEAMTQLLHDHVDVATLLD